MLQFSCSKNPVYFFKKFNISTEALILLRDREKENNAQLPILLNFPYLYSRNEIDSFLLTNASLKEKKTTSVLYLNIKCRIKIHLISVIQVRA